jgi:hypothetical protein
MIFSFPRSAWECRNSMITRSHAPRGNAARTLRVRLLHTYRVTFPRGAWEREEKEKKINFTDNG